MRRIKFSSVAFLASLYSSTSSNKRHDFRGRKLQNIKCVFRFSLQLASEPFLILRRVQPDIVVNVKISSRKTPINLVRFELNLNSLCRFRETLMFTHSRKSVQWKPSYSMQTDRRTDGRTDRYDKSNSRSSQFCERAYKQCDCNRPTNSITTTWSRCSSVLVVTRLIWLIHDTSRYT
jgi:hypothetical protein